MLDGSKRPYFQREFQTTKMMTTAISVLRIMLMAYSKFFHVVPAEGAEGKLTCSSERNSPRAEWKLTFYPCVLPVSRFLNRMHRRCSGWCGLV
jgi:hypothetical protein